MELFTAAEDLKFLNSNQIIKEAVKIPAKSSPLKFLLITLTLILPLSLIQLFFEISLSRFLITFGDSFSTGTTNHSSAVSLIRTYSVQELFYILSLFLFTLVSTSAIVFTVASLYASKPVSFIPALFAIPRMFKHLVITFFYVLLLMIFNYLVFCTPGVVLAWLDRSTDDALSWGLIIIFSIFYVCFHLYVTTLWHLASVISVLEPNVYGLAAMKKSKQLLAGRTSIALALASLYGWTIWTLELAFQFGMQHFPPVHFMGKVLFGLLCLFMMAAVNLTGLLVQSVFYFACKSHHNQVVDKRVLYDHLGGYDLGDKSVALNPSTGSVEMQRLVKDHGRRSVVGYQPVAAALNATTSDSINMQTSSVTVTDHDTVEQDQNV
ncbi:hypothetical protein MKW94_018218 [Papaver nudicaule]|uniref:Uncharacterized protein n=1 Tax=Papaver nudicaule TaxID=74823 RepID=A0AA41S0L6_PAPNU|nr:hypothetical protein [Papaver nudicaule]